MIASKVSKVSNVSGCCVWIAEPRLVQQPSQPWYYVPAEVDYVSMHYESLIL